ncbi:MAG: DUF192 domain-containing protein [Chthoniobacterales bacterium]
MMYYGNVTGRAKLLLSRLSGFLIAAALLLIFCDCQDKNQEKSAFGLRTIQLRIGSVPLRAEVADTPLESQTGLMFRNSLPEDQGMIFVFDAPRQANFWMKNTRIPLSIAYIDSAGKILEIRSMKPFDETLVRSAFDAVVYAREVNEGWFDRHKINPGTSITGLPRS